MSVTIKTVLKPVNKTTVPAFVKDFMKNINVPKLSGVRIITPSRKFVFLKLSSKTLLDVETNKIWTANSNRLYEMNGDCSLSVITSCEKLNVTVSIEEEA